jgi:hypothetical protein
MKIHAIAGLAGNPSAAKKTAAGLPASSTRYGKIREGR